MQLVAVNSEHCVGARHVEPSKIQFHDVLNPVQLAAVNSEHFVGARHVEPLKIQFHDALNVVHLSDLVMSEHLLISRHEPLSMVQPTSLLHGFSVVSPNGKSSVVLSAQVEHELQEVAPVVLLSV